MRRQATGRLRETYLNLDEPLLGKSWLVRRLETSTHNAAGKVIGPGRPREVASGFLCTNFLRWAVEKSQRETIRKHLYFYKDMHVHTQAGMT